uniref:Uncharacterized protein n=1 Tax=Knipowitschia caucasica TaxID=637954 RepID=A0AAV2IUF3_KNICA
MKCAFFSSADMTCYDTNYHGFLHSGVSAWARSWFAFMYEAFDMEKAHDTVPCGCTVSTEHWERPVVVGL